MLIFQRLSIFSQLRHEGRVILHLIAQLHSGGSGRGGGGKGCCFLASKEKNRPGSVLWLKFTQPMIVEELMLLNCGVGEDSWESLGLQGDPASPS